MNGYHTLKALLHFCTVSGGRAAVMILAITIIRALAISLLPKKTFLALWGIAVARLLLPFSLPSMFSVYSLIGNQTSGIAATKVPQINKVLPMENRLDCRMEIGRFSWWAFSQLLMKSFFTGRDV